MCHKLRAVYCDDKCTVYIIVYHQIKVVKYRMLDNVCGAIDIAELDWVLKILKGNKRI